MLPDLPNLKRDLQKVLNRLFKNMVNSRIGFLAELPKSISFEGKRICIIKADGSIDDIDLKESSVEIELNLDEIPRITPNKLLEMIKDSADKMARKISNSMFESLNETLEKAGQSVDNQGKPLDAEAVFEVMEKLQLEFDETGNIDTLSLVVSPSLAPKAKHVLEQIKSDPTLRKRHDEIIGKKWLEWRDREATRKLVG